MPTQQDGAVRPTPFSICEQQLRHRERVGLLAIIIERNARSKSVSIAQFLHVSQDLVVETGRHRTKIAGWLHQPPVFRQFGYDGTHLRPVGAVSALCAVTACRFGHGYREGTVVGFRCAPYEGGMRSWLGMLVDV